MKKIFRLLLLALGFMGLQTPGSYAQQTAPHHDGQHDFDFNFGKWRTHIKRLDHPLSGSKNWISMEGTVTIKKVWGGQGQLEEIEADGGKWRGITLFLYNPKTGQWSQTFANMSDGILEPPIVGGFKDGRGELYGKDTYNGRPIMVRGVWSDIKPNSHKFEQAFSVDGGKTWEVNFSGSLERIE